MIRLQTCVPCCVCLPAGQNTASGQRRAKNSQPRGAAVFGARAIGAEPGLAPSAGSQGESDNNGHGRSGACAQGQNSGNPLPAEKPRRSRVCIPSLVSRGPCQPPSEDSLAPERPLPYSSRHSAINLGGHCAPQHGVFMSFLLFCSWPLPFPWMLLPLPWLLAAPCVCRRRAITSGFLRHSAFSVRHAGGGVVSGHYRAFLYGSLGSLDRLCPAGLDRRQDDAFGFSALRASSSCPRPSVDPTAGRNKC